jgi:hypothetical protein
MNEFRNRERFFFTRQNVTNRFVDRNKSEKRRKYKLQFGKCCMAGGFFFPALEGECAKNCGKLEPTLHHPCAFENYVGV